MSDNTVGVFVLGLQPYEHELLKQRLQDTNVNLMFHTGKVEQTPLPSSARFCIASKQCNHSGFARAKRAYGANTQMCRGGLTRMADMIRALKGVETRTTLNGGPPLSAQAPDVAAAMAVIERNAAAAASESPLRFTELPKEMVIVPPAKPASAAPHRTAEVARMWTDLRPVAENDTDCVAEIATALGLKRTTVRVYLRQAGIATRGGESPLVSAPTPVAPHPSTPAPAPDEPYTVRVGPAAPEPDETTDLAGDLALIEQLLAVYRRMSPAAREFVRKGLR